MIDAMGAALDRNGRAYTPASGRGPHEARRFTVDEGDRPREEPRPEAATASSSELLVRARGGDRAALEHLCARYLLLLRRWATGRIPRAARDLLDTDDLVQDVVAQTVRRLDAFEYRREGALQFYLRQALRNRILNELRRARRRPPHGSLDSSELDGAASPLEQVIGAEKLERYEAALARLNDQEREAIVARFELGQSYERIAEILEKPSANAARMAVSRALARLAIEMSDAS